MKVVRTLVIEHDVPFVVVGKTWLFEDRAVETILSLVAAHRCKSEKLGLKKQTRRKARAVA